MRMEWLEGRLKELRKSKKGLAEALGVEPPRITDIIKGERRIKREEVGLMAEYLEWGRSRLERLIDGAVSTEDDGAVPVVADVGAGEEVHGYPQTEAGAGHGRVDPPLGIELPGGVVAVRVRGNSMFPAYWEGDLLFYRRESENTFLPELCLHNECIVAVVDGPTYIKRVVPGSIGGRYTLQSYNAADILDVAIDWAAPVLVHDKQHRRRPSGSGGAAKVERLASGRRTLNDLTSTLKPVKKGFFG